MEDKTAASATVYCNYNIVDSPGTAEALNTSTPEGFRVQETNIDLVVASSESPTGQHSVASELPTLTSTRASIINIQIRLQDCQSCCLEIGHQLNLLAENRDQGLLTETGGQD